MFAVYDNVPQPSIRRAPKPRRARALATGRGGGVRPERREHEGEEVDEMLEQFIETCHRIFATLP